MKHELKLTMRILGIETSCDETGIAIYDERQGLLAHRLYSQIELHAAYGGVVPELASRDHILKTLPLIDQTLQAAQCTSKDIDAIAYTAGPGLVGALLVGATLAKSLAFAWQKPTIAVHHLEAHVLSVMLTDPKPSFPFLALLISGGHTMLIAAHAIGRYEIIGETLDDAAGEAFDKVAKMLELGYPGGPQVAKLAERGRPGRFNFPRPLCQAGNVDFSFSGLKTAVALAIQAAPSDPQTHADIAHAFEIAVVDTLVYKCKQALKKTGFTQCVIAGGVSANQRLRQAMQTFAHQSHAKIFFPPPALCTDNGVMIAYAGLCHVDARDHDHRIQVRARWPLDQLTI